MTLRFATGLATSALAATFMTPSAAQPVYLNNSNITVQLGPTMPANPFQNLGVVPSLANVINAPSATASEFHSSPTTHVWVSGGPLELVFDFGIEYDLSALHFWNYHSESFDVDNINFTAYDGGNSVVGTLTLAPPLGNGDGSDSSPINSFDYVTWRPSRVRYVNAFLTGSNNEVDFNNLGFTAVVSVPSPIPEPETYALMLAGFGLLGVAARRRKRAAR